MSSLYEPLSRDSYEVRLLALVASPSAGIECTVRKHSLVLNPPPYVALSYCWGDESVRTDMIVNGQVVSVTANLKEALRHLHARTGDTVLWVDALCINQSDTQERSLQVGIMKQIFEKANIVYAWLGGDGFEGALAGIHNARALVEAGTPADITPAISNLSIASTGLYLIFSRPLWQRRWIIQELTAASKVEILCNTAHLSWNDLDQAYERCSSSKYWLGEHKLVATSYHKISHLRRAYWQGTLPNLCEAIVETREYLSKDPRDNIYALLGITSDGLALVPTPNYFQNVGQASEELTRAVLHRNANLNIILADSRTRVTTGSLPTWSPDWCSASVTSEAGLAANAELRHPRGFVANRVPGVNGVLRVKGVTIGTITALTSSFDGHALRSSTANTVVNPASNQSCKRYYNSRSGIARALVTSLLRSDSTMLIWPEVLGRLHWQRLEDTVIHILLFLQWIPSMWVPGVKDTLARYKIWLQANTSFSLDQASISSSLWPFYIDKVSMGFGIAITLLDVVCLFGLVSIPALGKSRGTTSYTIVSAFVLVPFLSWPTLRILVSLYGGLNAASRLSDKMNSSHRVFVLDQGAIGFSCNDSRHGDHICLLAGCSKAVVLRSHAVGGLASHMVIGEAMVRLNKRDTRKYHVLLSRTTTEQTGRGRRPFARLRTPDETYELYNQEDWWESFNLI